MPRAAAIALAVLLAAAAPAAAAPATPAEIVAKLNAVRAAHGLPAGLTLDADWTQACRQHNAYMAANDTLTHDETPGRPGYTGGGAWAGQNSVLSQGSSWTRGTVFLNAPIHLQQILSPRLTSLGAAESETHVCMTSWPGYRDASSAPVDTLYSFPGNGTRFPHLQRAAERPWTPQTRVGIREGATTGPYLYVWWEGPSAEESHDPETGEVTQAAQRPLEVISAAQVIGPDGPVDARIINREDVSGYIARSSGWVLPVKPLQPGALYTVAVTFSTEPGSDAPRSWTGAFQFTATAARLLGYIPTPGLDALSFPGSAARGAVARRGVKVRVTLDGPGVADARLMAGGRTVGAGRRTLRSGGRASVRVKPFPGSLPRSAGKLTLRVGVAGEEHGPFHWTKRTIRLR